MPTFISTIKFTELGIKAIGETDEAGSFAESGGQEDGRQVHEHLLDLRSL